MLRLRGKTEVYARRKSHARASTPATPKKQTLLAFLFGGSKFLRCQFDFITSIFLQKNLFYSLHNEIDT